MVGATCLFAYHVFLMCTGQTTKEHLTMGKGKGKRKEGQGEAGAGAAGPGDVPGEGKTESKDSLGKLEREDVDEDVKVCGRRGVRLVNPRAWIPFPERLLDPPLVPVDYNPQDFSNRPS